MLEKHEREQYFWDSVTVEQVADVASRFESPCALCAPLLGVELEKRSVVSRVLDVDDRFSHLSGFTRYDIYRPVWLGEEFGAIVCDPPFWIVSLSQLFTAIRLLSRYDTTQPLAICYPSRRGTNLCGTFARFGLRATGFFPKYLTVQSVERNEIEFFANFEWTNPS
jgi:hypothetical protein